MMTMPPLIWKSKAAIRRTVVRRDAVEAETGPILLTVVTETEPTRIAVIIFLATNWRVDSHFKINAFKRRRKRKPERDISVPKRNPLTPIGVAVLLLFETEKKAATCSLPLQHPK